MIELVIFDLDGTLIDNEKFTIISKVIEGKKIGYEISEEIAKNTLGLSTKKSKEYFISIYGEDFPYDFFRQKRFDYIIDDIKQNGVKFKKGVQEIINYLNEKSIKKAICTSSTKKYLNAYKKYSNIFDNFDIIITGEEIKNGKPNPEIFLKAMDRLNINYKNTLIIEDSNNGIIAGVNSNADVIMIPDLVSPNKEVLEQNVKIYNSLLEVINYIENTNQKEKLNGNY